MAVYIRFADINYKGELCIGNAGKLDLGIERLIQASHIPVVVRIPPLRSGALLPLTANPYSTLVYFDQLSL